MSHDKLRRQRDAEARFAHAHARPNILILEYEVLIAIDLQETLKELGLCDIVICHRLDIALMAVQGQSFDIAFLDHMIGAFSSIDLGQHLTQSGTKVVFTSGLDRGAIAGLPPTSLFIAKPYSEQQIEAVLDRIIADGQTDQPEMR